MKGNFIDKLYGSFCWDGSDEVPQDSPLWDSTTAPTYLPKHNPKGADIRVTTLPGQKLMVTVHALKSAFRNPPSQLTLLPEHGVLLRFRCCAKDYASAGVAAFERLSLSVSTFVGITTADSLLNTWAKEAEAAGGGPWSLKNLAEWVHEELPLDEGDDRMLKEDGSDIFDEDETGPAFGWALEEAGKKAGRKWADKIEERNRQIDEDVVAKDAEIVLLKAEVENFRTKLSEANLLAAKLRSKATKLEKTIEDLNAEINRMRHGKPPELGLMGRRTIRRIS